ncbi:response regulator transcription factor [Shinella sumterensis]|uniref:response regulator transcription factor n=1 Tax=Shinella sumterensis TaxID=1967501 RepID=UPI001E420DA0|nr:response regulator [Shinella sumterensis]
MPSVTQGSGLATAIRLREASTLPIAEALHGQRPVLIDDLAAITARDLPTGGWRIPPKSAAVVPVMPTGETGRSGALVVDLEAMGHVVFEVVSAEEALKVLSREAIDLLLTDIGLPGMSGAELAVECRRQKPGLGIIFASGAAGIPRVDGHEWIADAVILGKPYDESALANAMKQI